MMGRNVNWKNTLLGLLGIVGMWGGTNAQTRYWANSQTSTVGTNCVNCRVENQTNAVDANRNNYSRLFTWLGPNLPNSSSVSVSQRLFFPISGVAGDEIVLIISIPDPDEIDSVFTYSISNPGQINPLISGALLDYVRVGTGMGTTNNSDVRIASSNNVGLIDDSTNIYYVTFQAGAAFNNVIIEQGSAGPGYADMVDVYGAYFVPASSPNPIVKANGQTTGTTGTCVLCEVQNAANAADGDLSTYSTLSIPLGVSGSVFQDVIFPASGCAGDTLTAVIENPGGIISTTIDPTLKVMTISMAGGATVALSTRMGGSPGVSNNEQFKAIDQVVEVLDNVNRYTFRFLAAGPFDRMRIQLNSGTIGTLAKLNVFDASMKGKRVPPTPSASSVTICYGKQATLLATPPSGASCSWFKNKTGGTALATNTNTFTTPALTASDTFWVQSVDVATGCPNLLRVPVMVTVKPDVTAPSIADSFNVCTGNGLTITPMPAGGLFHFYADPLKATLLASGSSYNTGALTSNKTYFVFQEVGGCISTKSDTVRVLVSGIVKSATPKAGSVEICEGTRATLIGVTTGVTGHKWYTDSTGGFLLSTKDTLVSPVLTQNTTYWLAAVDTANPCRESLVRVPVNVSVIPLPNLPKVVDTAVVCIGDSVTLKASTIGPDSLFSWFGSQFGSDLLFTGNPYIFRPTMDTTRIWVATNRNTCLSPGRIQTTVIRIPVLPVPVFKDTTICQGQSVVLEASTPVYKGMIQWYDAPAGGKLLAQGEVLNTGVLQQTTKYYVQVKTAQCLSARGEVTVTVNATPPVPSIPDTLRVCRGDSAYLSASTAVSSDLVFWYDSLLGGNLLGSGKNYSFYPAQDTTILFVESKRGDCISMGRTRVAVILKDKPELPKVNDTVICMGQSTTLTASGTPGSKFHWWDASSGGSLLATSKKLNTPPLQNTTVYYVEADLNGCLSPRIPVTVYINDSLASPILSCAESTLDAVTFIWNNVPGSTGYEFFINGAKVAAYPAGVFSHTETNLDRGEAVTGSVRAIGDLPCGFGRMSPQQICRTKDCEAVTFDLPSRIEICLGESADIVLSNISTSNYEVIFENGLPSNRLIYKVSPTQTREYKIRVYNPDQAKYCDTTFATVTVVVNDNPVAAFGEDTTRKCLPEAVIRFFSQTPGAKTWEWNFGDGQTSNQSSPAHTYQKAGTYSVRLKVTNQYGCSDETEKQGLISICLEPEIFVPNGFTPNGDNLNEVFKAEGEGIAKFHLKVFNQWGLLLWQTTDKNSGWNGTYNGADQPEGVYVWSLVAELENNIRIVRTGNVTLIR